MPLQNHFSWKRHSESSSPTSHKLYRKKKLKTGDRAYEKKFGMHQPLSLLQHVNSSYPFLSQKLQQKEYFA